jgi:hypothetical protein
MIEGYTCYLDTSKIDDTLETLKSIDSCLSNKDLKESFFEMEDLLNRLNFEHGNFTTTYKETLDIIENELSKIKKDIYSLGFGIERTSEVLTDEREKTVRDIQELSSDYGSSLGIGVPSDSPLKVFLKRENSGDIAEVITTGIQEQQEPSSHDEINTVPVGIGIGVAGVVGAAGAIIYDSLRGNQEDDSIKDYEPPKEEREFYQDPREYEQEFEFEDPSPYYAIHNRDSMKKFYGDNNDNNNLN